jgi:hypothetical protein
MAAIPKPRLVELEAEYGLTEDGLTYQLRCSRITAIQKGEEWEAPKVEPVKRGTIESERSGNPFSAIESHPLYGKTLLIAPMMTVDKDRALYFDEKLGPEFEVKEVNAGALMYGTDPNQVDRISGDYEIVRVNENKVITAKTSIPKAGQEITYRIGFDLVPIVRGNDGNRGYIWAFPTHVRQYEDTLIQLYGLKTLITQQYPQLLERFKGKPMMTYIDGMCLTASIPLTDALLAEQRRKDIQDDKLGLR